MIVTKNKSHKAYMHNYLWFCTCAMQHCCKLLTQWIISCSATDVIVSVKATIHVYPALQLMKTNVCQ